MSDDGGPPPSAQPEVDRRLVGSVACLSAIFLVAMNLRPAASVSPVLPTILGDFGVGTVYGGYLTNCRLPAWACLLR